MLLVQPPSAICTASTASAATVIRFRRGTFLVSRSQELGGRNANRQPREQRQRRETAEQVQHHDQRLQQQCDRPHAEQALKDHERDQRDRQNHRLLRIAAVGDREPCQRHDQQPERRGEVSVHHLLDGLVILERPVRERFVDHIDVAGGVVDTEMAVTARPVRAAETGGAQAHPRAEHDDGEGEHDARQREAPEQAVTRGHGSLCA